MGLLGGKAPPSLVLDEVRLELAVGEPWGSVPVPGVEENDTALEHAAWAPEQQPKPRLY